MIGMLIQICENFLNVSPSPTVPQEYVGFKGNFCIGCHSLIWGIMSLVLPIDYLVLCLFWYMLRMVNSVKWTHVITPWHNILIPRQIYII